jgi:hypothetical protein
VIPTSVGSAVVGNEEGSTVAGKEEGRLVLGSKVGAPVEAAEVGVTVEGNKEAEGDIVAGVELGEKVENVGALEETVELVLGVELGAADEGRVDIASVGAALGRLVGR